MKTFLNKLIKTKGLPFQPIGTTLIEVLLFCLAVIGLVGIVNYLWSSSVAILAWLFSLTLWGFLYTKKAALIQEKFDEIDQRDMDFKDECDRHFSKLEQVAKRVRSKKSSNNK